MLRMICQITLKLRLDIHSRETQSFRMCTLSSKAILICILSTIRLSIRVSITEAAVPVWYTCLHLIPTWKFLITVGHLCETRHSCQKLKTDNSTRWRCTRKETLWPVRKALRDHNYYESQIFA